jgi:hypothetical protein
MEEKGLLGFSWKTHLCISGHRLPPHLARTFPTAGTSMSRSRSTASNPSIAPGTATISHGGFSYYEGKDILREVARRFEVVGADFVEVSPPYDPSGITALLAARTSLDFIGSIFHERAKRRTRPAPWAKAQSSFQPAQHAT